MQLQKLMKFIHLFGIIILGSAIILYFVKSNKAIHPLLFISNDLLFYIVFLVFEQILNFGDFLLDILNPIIQIFDCFPHEVDIGRASSWLSGWLGISYRSCVRSLFLLGLNGIIVRLTKFVIKVHSFFLQRLLRGRRTSFVELVVIWNRKDRMLLLRVKNILVLNVLLVWALE